MRRGDYSPPIKNERVMLLENILQAVGNVGFPIAVAAYLLVRIEGKLEVLADSIARLAEAVAGDN